MAVSGRNEVAFSVEASPFLAQLTVNGGQSGCGILRVPSVLDVHRDGSVTITGTIGGRTIGFITSSL